MHLAKPPYLYEYTVLGGFLELGVKIDILDLLGFYINDYGTTKIKTLDILYIGQIISGVPKAHDDIESISWHSVDSLPQTKMASVTKAFIDLPRWYKSHRNLLK